MSRLVAPWKDLKRNTGSALLHRWFEVYELEYLRSICVARKFIHTGSIRIQLVLNMSFCSIDTYARYPTVESEQRRMKTPARGLKRSRRRFAKWRRFLRAPCSSLTPIWICSCVTSGFAYWLWLDVRVGGGGEKVGRRRKGVGEAREKCGRTGARRRGKEGAREEDLWGSRYGWGS